MKRLFLVVVAVLSMTATFAENGYKKPVNHNIEAYVFDVNVYRLGEVLSLNNSQYDAVREINDVFQYDLKRAGVSNEKNRQRMLDKAVTKNLYNMRQVLDTKQYRTYLMLLNATFSNRGLK